MREFINPSFCYINPNFPVDHFFSVPKDLILLSNIKYQVKKGENKRGIEGEREREKRDGGERT